MTALRIFFFAEFAIVALMAPAIGLMCRRVISRLLVAALPLFLALVPLCLIVASTMPLMPWLDVAYLQFLAVAFGVATCGVAVLLGRRWPQSGPLLTTLAAMAVLATPLWGDVLWMAGDDALRVAARSTLTVANPLLVVARELGNYDWTHSAVLYGTYGGLKLTSLGEDFPYSPARLSVLVAAYLAVGLGAAAIAGLVRQKGRPAEYLLPPSEFV